MRVQQVLWDTALQNELMQEIQKKPIDITSQDDWSSLIHDVCKRYFPDADQYQLIIEGQNINGSARRKTRKATKHY